MFEGAFSCQLSAKKDPACSVTEPIAIEKQEGAPQGAEPNG
jgi:hypothetical protein